MTTTIAAHITPPEPGDRHQPRERPVQCGTHRHWTLRTDARCDDCLTTAS
jgi:hypothetical protein